MREAGFVDIYMEPLGDMHTADHRIQNALSTASTRRGGAPEALSYGRTRTATMPAKARLLDEGRLCAGIPTVHPTFDRNSSTSRLKTPARWK